MKLHTFMQEQSFCDTDFHTKWQDPRVSHILWRQCRLAKHPLSMENQTLSHIQFELFISMLCGLINKYFYVSHYGDNSVWPLLTLHEFVSALLDNFQDWQTFQPGLQLFRHAGPVDQEFFWLRCEHWYLVVIVLSTITTTRKKKTNSSTGTHCTMSKRLEYITRQAYKRLISKKQY